MKNVVIFPTYNERENIERMIRTVFSLPRDFHILVVDDHSPDGTAAIVKHLQDVYQYKLFLIERGGKQGLGTAYIAGFEWALEQGYDYIFEMDADFSHDPYDLLRLHDACVNNVADLAIGSRYITGVNVVNWPMSRVLMSYCASKYVRFITRMKVRDTTAGFKCYKREVLGTIPFDKIRFKGYAFQIEMKFTAWKYGFSLVEVPIIFHDRSAGTSKMSGGIFSEALLGVVMMKWRSFFRKYNMKQFFTFFAVIFLLLQIRLAVFAQDQQVVDKLIKIANTDNQTMKHLDVLTNRIGGRLIGSDAYGHATLWAVSLFEKWGLEVEIQEVGEVPVGFNRGPWFGKMLDDDGMTLHFATPSYTSGTKGVQRGHVVAEPKSRRQFESMRGKLKGAWVLISGDNDGLAIDVSERGEAKRKEIIQKNDEISRYNDSITRINRSNPNNPPIPLKELQDAPALFYKEMIEAGILGTIQSSTVPIRALYSRNVWQMDFYNHLPTCPDIKLDENQYRIIAQKVKERRYCQLEFDIRNHFFPGPVKYHNVIGIIRGTEFPDEYVMTGGHLDSYDAASGAVDCGTGVAPNLEAARLLMETGAKPRRSILFCLWAGEEFGLLGSKFWVEQNKDKWDKISNYFNRDGGPTIANSLTVPPAMYDDFNKAIGSLNDINPDFPFTLSQRRGDPPQRPATAGGSDHAYFAMNGIPTISFGTADPKGYDFNYGEIWHTERDTYNMSIPEYMEHTSVVTAIMVYYLAMQDKLLSREGLYREPSPAGRQGRTAR